ncbi:MAG: hypothetical protein HDR04_20595 [Lachnospiraceae bacterium]|nr:hypothetical protein [Lachnospiraceae bacterium]
MFIGINNPTIYAPENFLEKRIVFDGVKLNGVNDIVWRAERSTDQAEAFKLWSAAAEQGNAEAQYRLGICYYNGKGVNQDYVEALKWIRKAAGKNHAKVFTHNGYSYMDFQKCIATNPIIALKKDGTVVENMEIPTQNWKNVIAVFSGDRVIAGLKSNGTVVTVKHTYRNIAQTLIFPGDETQCGTQDWRDIINLSVKDEFIVGVKSDGRVVTNKEIYNGQCDVRNWRDIVAVSIGNDYIIGLKKDGTVVVAGDNHYRQCAIQNWRDIVAVSTGRYHTIGLKKDGTVIVAGLQDGTDENDDNDLLCSVHVNRDVVKKVQNWNDIIAISFDGRSIIVGLKKDGTVVSADISPHLGTMQEDQCNVRNWRDIVAVSTGNGCTVGLKRDGTICVTPNGNTTQYCSNWSNIGLVLNELEVTEDTIASGQTLSIAQT